MAIKTIEFSPLQEERMRSFAATLNEKDRRGLQHWKLLSGGTVGLLILPMCWDARPKQLSGVSPNWINSRMIRRPVGFDAREPGEKKDWIRHAGRKQLDRLSPGADRRRS